MKTKLTLLLFCLLSRSATILAQVPLEEIPLTRRWLASMSIPLPPPPPRPPRPLIEEIFRYVPKHEGITIYRNPSSGVYYHVFAHKSGRSGVRYGLKELDGDTILRPYFTSLVPIPQVIEDSSALRFMAHSRESGFNVYDIQGERFFRRNQTFIALAQPGYLVVTPPDTDTTFIVQSNGDRVAEPNLSMLGQDVYLQSTRHPSIYTTTVAARKYSGLVDQSGRFVHPVLGPKVGVDYADKRSRREFLGFRVSKYNEYAALLDSTGRLVWTSDALSLKEVFPGAIVVEEMNGERQAIITTRGDTLLPLGPWKNIQYLAGNYKYKVWKLSENYRSGTGRYGLVNSRGEEILRPVYKSIQPLYGHADFRVIDALGKAGLVDPDGDVLLPCRCDHASMARLGDRLVYVCKLNGLIELYTPDKRMVLKRPVKEVEYSSALTYMMVADEKDRFAVYDFDGQRLTRHRFLRVSTEPVTPTQKAIAARYPQRVLSVGIWATDTKDRGFVIDADGNVSSLEIFFE